MARNLDDMPFPARMTRADHERFTDLLKTGLLTVQSCQFGPYQDSAGVPRDGLRVLRERNLVTREVELQRPSGYVLSDCGLTLLVHDEDHLHVQALGSGCCAEELCVLANRVDDELNAQMPWAFSRSFGYLAARVMNCGTGLKISYMMHLTCLAQAGMISTLRRECAAQGLTLDSVEPGEPRSGLCVLSHGCLSGLSETELLSRLDQAVLELAGREEQAREEAFDLDRRLIEDRIARAAGILSSCRLLPYAETMELLSLVRLGVYYSFPGFPALTDIDDAMVWAQPGHLLLAAGDAGESLAPDALRADYIRTNLFRGAAVNA